MANYLPTIFETKELCFLTPNWTIIYAVIQIHWEKNLINSYNLNDIKI